MMYLVECKPDEILIKVLTSASRRQIRHAGNKSELLKKLTERFTNAKGMVDEDPLSHQPPHLRKFEEKHELAMYDLKVLHQKSGNNTLIVLCPRLEDWILKAAREANINLESYGLPDNPEKLHEQINIKTDNFQKLVENVQAKSERLKKLKQRLLRNNEPFTFR
jgi:uncharacterized coiled-coil protein SlyX